MFLIQSVTCSLKRSQRHIKDTTDLDLRLEIDTECWMLSKLYVRRDVVNFSFICFNILTTYAYGVNTSLQLMRYYRACIFSLYFLDRGLFLNLIVTDEVYSRNTAWAVLWIYTSYYFLSTSNSNMDLGLRGCSPKFVLSVAITIWLIHAKYWSHRSPNICPPFQ